MNNNIFITDEELRIYGSTVTLSDKAFSLLLHQKNNWELVKKNFLNLDKIKTKEIDFGDFKFKIQFNPSRITSTSAKVDKKSIENRNCFLCNENLPPQQKGIKYLKDYIILINPFPIFNKHLTIPHVKHIPQTIENSFKDFLQLSYDLRDDYFVFYNGPKCGASAPDHLHFQAGEIKTTPLQYHYRSLTSKFGDKIYQNDSINLYSVNYTVTKFIYFESNNIDELKKMFYLVLGIIKTLLKLTDEPMINIISFYDKDWKVFLFLREKHRPEQYFMNDDSQLLVSPASADLSGLCITPRESDFKKITKSDLENICSQVLITNEKYQTITKKIKEKLANVK